MRNSDHSLRFGRLCQGQSLVETALFLPVILFLFAGILEVSNLLITQNRVSTAARAGTGFGATNYNEDGNLADTFNAMSDVALNNVTDTLDLNPNRWDIYTLKATVNDAGDSFTEWVWDRPYGNEQVFPETEWMADEAGIQSDILDALGPSADGMEIVATVTYHDRASFLNLGFFDVDELTRIRGLTVMRISATEGSYGACDTFPIGINLKNYSIYPSDYDWEADSSWKSDYDLYPFEEGEDYVGNSYWWPHHSNNAKKPPPPTYTVSFNGNFPTHKPGIALGPNTPRGTLFLVKEPDPGQEGIAGAFGWLRWNEDSNAQSAPELESSLTWPGNSDIYKHSPWSDDGALNTYDMVLVSTGSVVSSKDEMRVHIDKGVESPPRELRVIVFTPPDYVAKSGYAPGDANNDGSGTGVAGQPGVLGGGTNFEYEVFAFARIRMVAWDLSGTNSWMLMEFRGWDVECGNQQ